MAYIYPAPGVAAKESWLKIKDANNDGGYTANALLTVPAMLDITVNAAKNSISWTQLDSTGTFTIPTTSSNNISGNLVVDKDSFYGDGTTDGIKAEGLFNAQESATLVDFEVYTGDTSDGAEGKFISGQGYVTGLSPAWSSDAPYQVSPFTITVLGAYTVEDTAQVTAP